MAKRKLNPIWMTAAFAVVAASLWITFSTSFMAKHERYDDMLAAARKMAEATAEIKRMRAELGIPISPADDPNGTGLIGQELTDITTTVGNLQSKRTSTNPDFAALTVSYFDKLGLKDKDLVAVGASGSFPGIMISVLSACYVTGVEPVIIPSIGASEYGANIPGLTSVEMLDRLNEAGIFDYVPAAISLGGAGDIGEGGIIADSKPILQRIADESGHRVIVPADTPDSIRQRMAAFEAAGEIKAFINIGGAEPNFGSTSASLEVSNGIVTKPPRKVDSPDMGLIFEYLNKGVPVIHFLDIKGLAMKSGIPVDPVPLPAFGTSMVYFQKKYEKAYAAAGLVAAVLLVTIPVALGKGKGLGKR